MRRFLPHLLMRSAGAGSNLRISEFRRLCTEPKPREAVRIPSHTHQTQRSADCGGERAKALKALFPLSQDLGEIIARSPEVLRWKPEVVKEMSSVFLMHGDTEVMTEEETLYLFERCPDLLLHSAAEVESRLVQIFASCALYPVPWSTLFIENPQLIFSEKNTIYSFLSKLSGFFKKHELYDLIRNNPSVIQESYAEIEQKIKFLLHTMNVSLDRISKTENSLSQPLEFYHIRYELLNRAGLYRHPDPNQKGMRMNEAAPFFANIVSGSDAEFLQACAPDITHEEFIVFKSLLFIEKEEVKNILGDWDLLDPDQFLSQEDEIFSESYGKKKRQKKKAYVPPAKRV